MCGMAWVEKFDRCWLGKKWKQWWQPRLPHCFDTERRIFLGCLYCVNYTMYSRKPRIWETLPVNDHCTIQIHGFDCEIYATQGVCEFHVKRSLRGFQPTFLWWLVSHTWKVENCGIILPLMPAMSTICFTMGACLCWAGGTHRPIQGSSPSCH